MIVSGGETEFSEFLNWQNLLKFLPLLYIRAC